MTINKGSGILTGVYKGSTPVTGIYKGATKLWPLASVTNWIDYVSVTTKALSTSSLSMPVSVQTGDLLVLVGGDSSTVAIDKIKDSQNNTYSTLTSLSTRRNKLQMRFAVAKATGTNTYTGAWYEVGSAGVVGVLVFRKGTVVNGTQVSHNDSNFVSGPTVRSLTYSTTDKSILLGMFDTDGDTNPVQTNDSDFAQSFSISGFSVLYAIKNAPVSATLQYSFPAAGSIWTFGALLPLIKA